MKFLLLAAVAACFFGLGPSDPIFSVTVACAEGTAGQAAAADRQNQPWHLDSSGNVIIDDQAAFEALLQGVFADWKSAVRRGDIDAAAAFFVSDKRGKYYTVMKNFTIPYASVDNYLNSVKFLWANGVVAE